MDNEEDESMKPMQDSPQIQLQNDAPPSIHGGAIAEGENLAGDTNEAIAAVEAEVVGGEDGAVTDSQVGLLSESKRVSDSGDLGIEGLGEVNATGANSGEANAIGANSGEAADSKAVELSGEGDEGRAGNEGVGLVGVMEGVEGVGESGVAGQVDGVDSVDGGEDRRVVEEVVEVADGKNDDETMNNVVKDREVTGSVEAEAADGAEVNVVPNVVADREVLHVDEDRNEHEKIDDEEGELMVGSVENVAEGKGDAERMDNVADDREVAIRIETKASDGGEVTSEVGDRVVLNVDGNRNENEGTDNVIGARNENKGTDNAVGDRNENEGMDNVVGSGAVDGGKPNAKVENEFGDNAVIERNDKEVGDEQQYLEVADVPEEREMPMATEFTSAAGAVESEELVIDASVAEAQEETVLPTTADDAAVTEVVEDKKLVQNLNRDEAMEETVMPTATGGAAVAEVVEGNELAEDAELAEAPKETEDKAIIEEKPMLVAKEDTTAAGVVDGKKLEEAAEVAEQLEEATMPGADEDAAAAQLMATRELAENMDLTDMEMIDAAENTEMTDAETGVAEEQGKTVGGKRKRGRPPTRATTKEKTEEDVCFICFDGGDLVLCDRRGCPKAYHPTCVGHTEEYFRTKGQWNCGWHLCNNCQKNAYYMCYTCPFSLCKKCTKDAAIFCVRGNKGFCQTCMKTIMLIEENDKQKLDSQAPVNFDDKSTWEYLFKDYWLDLKQRLSITPDKLAQAKNPWKGSDVVQRREIPDELNDANSGGVSGSEPENVDGNTSKRKKTKKRLKAGAGKDSPSIQMATDYGEPSAEEGSDWASKELLEFVRHMKNGDGSALSQFDVQALLLEYIKINKLRDPRRKSQIICDSMLQNLFGKPRVGHFEMLKLLESHFLIREDPQPDDLSGSVADTETSQLEGEGGSSASMKTGKDKKRKSRRNEREPQTNLDDYAAIDIHNIALVYLRRNLVEELLEDVDSFHEKVVGSFVRIRISGSNQKQDIYRLVQVVGTSKIGEPYKVGKRMTDIVLEILNLNKTEVISIDVISNQDFTEDECKRLRQSIKCGLINRLTVGNVLEKAMALQTVRVNDWLQSEMTRLTHLRDRASETGRRKELRECVEKLQLLKTPEERERRVQEVPEVHADPNMDPAHESEEDEGQADEKRPEINLRQGGTGFKRRIREPPVSPRKEGPSAGTWNYRGFANDREAQQSLSGEKSKVVSSSQNYARDSHNREVLEPISSPVSEFSPVRPSAGEEQSSVKINESEKLWHYKDPSGKIQGPFSMVQLRKWNNTGYFPADLKIWKKTEKQDDAILLADALAGKFHKEPLFLDKAPVMDSHFSTAYSGKSYGSSNRTAASPAELLKNPASGWDSDYNGRKDSTNLPSPTPSTNESRVQSYAESKGSSNSHFVHQVSPTSETGQVRYSSTMGRSSVRVAGGIDDLGILKLSPTLNAERNSDSSLQIRSQSIVLGDSHKAQTNANLLQASDLPGGSVNLSSRIKDTVSSFQNSLISGSSDNPPVVSQTWGTNPSQKIEPNKPNSIPSHLPAYGHWGSASSSIQNSASSNPSGSFPIPGPSSVPLSESWGPAVNGNQTNIHPQGPSNLPRVMGHADNSGAMPRQPENLITTWGGVPAVGGNTNTGWGAPLPGNPNMNWGAPAQGSVPGTVNPEWTAPGSANAGGFPGNQGQPPVNVKPSWAPPGQGFSPGNAKQGWSAPAGNLGTWGTEINKNQDISPGNANPVWSVASGNPGTWVTEQNSNRGNFSPGNPKSGWSTTPEENRGTWGTEQNNIRNFSPGNAKSSWSAPHEKNPGMWGTERSNNRDNYSSHRDRGSHGRDNAYGSFSSHRDRGSYGGDNAYGRGKPWNRQPTFGSGSGGVSKPNSKGRGVCKFFHENGHCKKGASCDYLHI